MLKAQVKKHTLNFKRPGGTSRGVLTEKNSWIIELEDTSNPEVTGKGEASIIESLSPDWSEDYEDFLAEVCEKINDYANALDKLERYPSIRFALETALLDLERGGNSVLFPSAFTRGEVGIPINGLIWMGSKEFMEHQVIQKIDDGFDCIKMKIGAIDFETELNILESIRSNFSPVSLMLRVDANGAFSPSEAMDKLKKLADLEIHSIEQPIRAGQINEMKKLCDETPLPIALDEELIGVYGMKAKQKLLDDIQPQYIILKPSLLGGFIATDEWIAAANSKGIGWWITSALESNVGLNAIAQYTFSKNTKLHQGLGTGQLFTNNFESPLVIESGHLLMRW